jgi:hypothetical protein
MWNVLSPVELQLSWNLLLCLKDINTRCSFMDWMTFKFEKISCLQPGQVQYVLVLCVASFCRQTLSLHYITVQLFGMKFQRISPCRKLDIGVMKLGIRYLFCCCVALSLCALRARACMRVRARVCVCVGVRVCVCVKHFSVIFGLFLACTSRGSTNQKRTLSRIK